MENKFRKIGATKTLSQKIERKIEEAIRKKKLVKGDKLPSEKELCASFAVSRTAIREALRRLNARGLIEVRKGSGMHVAEIKIEDAINSLNLFYDLKFDTNLIRQIIEVRRMIEPEVAKLAAKNRTQKHLNILNKNIKDLIASDPDDTQLEVDLINRFHMNLSKATCNPIVIISLEPIYSLLPRMRDIIYANIEGEKEYTVLLQSKILNAVENQNVTNAYKYSTELLERNMKIYDTYFRQYQ